MANIGRAWRRVMFVADPHGNLQHKDRVDEALAIKLDFQPHLLVHLGDNWEFTALRRGASDSELNGDLQSDLEAGIEFLERFQPQLVFEGNHCKRIRYLMKKPDGRLALLASIVHERMMEAIRNIGAEWVQFDVTKGHRKIGAHLCMHGYAHGMNAVDIQRREFESPVIVGDGHASQMLTPRGLNRTPSYMVGALLDFDAVDYDKNNLSGLKRSHGVLVGEYCDGDSRLTLISSKPGEALEAPSYFQRNEQLSYCG